MKFLQSLDYAMSALGSADFLPPEELRFEKQAFRRRGTYADSFLSVGNSLSSALQVMRRVAKKQA